MSPAAHAKRAWVLNLRAGGKVYCQCNKAPKGIARALAMGSHEQADTVYQHLVAGLNPGVKLVPSNTMLGGLAQEHGCAYESV